MGASYPSIPPELAEALIRGQRLTAAVETGTYRGDSALMLRGMVPEVWTIELSPRYAQEARARFGDVDGIHLLEGESGAVLADLAPQLDRPALFWLDAHWWSEQDVAGAEAQCPLMAELAAIDSAPSAAESVILIDDARFFMGAPPGAYRRGDWPLFPVISDALRARHERYVTVLADVIIAAPPQSREVVETWYVDQEMAHMQLVEAQRLQLMAERDHWRSLWQEAVEPGPLVAARRLAKSVLPRSARRPPKRGSSTE